jgi:phosphomannomutase
MGLRLASFGLRGFVGESLTPAAAMDLSSAFATFLDGGRILVGRDTRHSSPMIHSAVVASLLGAGSEAVDLGICPAPVLQFAVRRLGAAGAIVISGGHHGMGWNSLTLIGRDGAVLDPVGGETVLDLLHAGAFTRAPWDRIGALRAEPGVPADYFTALEALVDAAAIRAAGFTILIDPVGGAACPLLDEFARRLGFRLVGINAQPSGYLAREPEPRPRSAMQLASFIGHVRGDAGFLLSSDAGRVSVVTETGEPASEEFTFALVADHVLDRQPGPVVTNGCTSRMIDDLCAARGVPLIKTPVGQAYVAAAMADEDAVLGGEGSGGVAVARMGPFFDGLLGIALILESMAVRRETISARLAALPRYHRVKRQIPCDARRGYSAMEEVKAGFEAGADCTVSTVDGLRVDGPDGWVHLRNSRTEQIVRIIAEARTRAASHALADDMARRLEQAL